MNEIENPIANIQPESLDELFSRPTLQLSDADIDKIIAKLRADRAMWEESEAKPKAPRSPKAPKAAQAKLTLDDLGLL